MNLEDLIQNKKVEEPFKVEEQNVTEEQITTFEITPQILGYPNEETQSKAYDIALKYCISLEPTTIIDVGCGRGDFFQHLNKVQLPVSYTGYEENKIISDNSLIPIINTTFKPENATHYDWAFFINSFDNRYSSMDEVMDFILETYKNVNKGVNIVCFNENILEVEPIFKPLEVVRILIENNISFIFEQDEYFYKIVIKK